MELEAGWRGSQTGTISLPDRRSVMRQSSWSPGPVSAKELVRKDGEPVILEIRISPVNVVARV